MERPKISVIIPVKNAEDVIGDCLEAVFAQSYEPYEVLVVDGHSKDKTVEEAKKFPVKIVYEEYGTRAGACRVGVENVRGEYVAFTDADCIPDKNWLKNLIKEFDSNIMGVGGRIINIGEGLWEKSINFAMNTFLGSANSVQGRFFKNKRFTKSISGCNSMYRRKDILKVGGFDTNLPTAEDTALNRKLLSIGKLLYTPDAFVLHNHKRGLKKFAKRMYQYGYGRGKSRLWDLQCVPPIIAPLLALFLVFAHWIFIGIISLYLLILIVMGFKFAMQEKDIRYLGCIPIVYVIEHCSYAIGFWKGFLKL